MFTCMKPCKLKQFTPVGSAPLLIQAIGVICFNLGSYIDSHGQRVPLVVTYARYACVADCADAMADAWEDTAGCAQPICLHENLLK